MRRIRRIRSRRISRAAPSATPTTRYDGARVEWNNGACDGWLRAGANDLYSIGYYRQQDLPFLGKVAPAFTTCDRFFASILGPTFPNRFYSLSGVTDRTSNIESRVDLPTIFDRFAAKKIPAAYYYGNFAFLLLYQRYNAISHPYSVFLQAVQDREAAGVLVHRPELHVRRLGRSCVR